MYALYLAWLIGFVAFGSFVTFVNPRTGQPHTLGVQLFMSLAWPAVVVDVALRAAFDPDLGDRGEDE